VPNRRCSADTLNFAPDAAKWMATPLLIDVRFTPKSRHKTWPKLRFKRQLRQHIRKSAKGLAGRNPIPHLPATKTSRGGVDGLIVHKVRGKPAFDVAVRFALSGGEEIWMIPTCGHRAYPFAYQALGGSFDYMTEFASDAEWEALPDHYPEPQRRKGTFAQLRARVAAAIATKEVA